jgi:hypothetical protein
MVGRVIPMRLSFKALLGKRSIAHGVGQAALLK